MGYNELLDFCAPYITDGEGRRRTMRLRVKNVGILSDSEIEIAGITVVAGENNTGKSTFGKALYSVFSALSHLGEHVELVKRQYAVRVATIAYADSRRLSSEDWFESVCDKLMENKLTEDLVDEIIESCPEDLSNGNDFFIRKTQEIIYTSDDEIERRLVLNSFGGEFRNQVQNQLHREEDSRVDLIIKDYPISVVIRNESIQSLDGIIDLGHVPVYIDEFTSSFGNNKFSQFSRWSASYQHNVNLYNIINSKLIGEKSIREDNKDSRVIQDILNDQLLKPVYDRLCEICHGSLRRVEKSIKFVDDAMPGVQLDMLNVSSGLKTFLILQELIRNGTICENGTLIMDEPEVHLHPQWQVVLAEMVVLLQKALRLHVLITSHSPYFISAIDVFAKKHGVIENNRYYFSSRKGNSVDVKDVTNEICVIYDSLAAPYQTIQDEANRVEE